MQGITKLLTGGTFAVRENLIVGYLAEIVHLPVTVPLEVRWHPASSEWRRPPVLMGTHVSKQPPCPDQVVITRIITSKGRVTSLTQAAREALKESGIAGLYKGITAYVRCMIELN